MPRTWAQYLRELLGRRAAAGLVPYDWRELGL